MIVNEPPPLLCEVQHVVDYWRRRVALGQMTLGTSARYQRVLESFTRFAIAREVSTMATVDVQICRAFLAAARQCGAAPAVSTSRFRLTVVRDSFGSLIAAGIVSHDPTLGLRVRQTAQYRSPFPLTPAEAVRLRSSGRAAPRDHLRPAVVELALAGASHEELAHVVVADINFDVAQVRYGSRAARLDAFACSTLLARIAACRREARRQSRPWDPSIAPIALARPLSTYPATSIAPSISSSLSRALSSAGLNRPGLRPSSVREYGANRVYARSGQAEAVAVFLGLTSLDTAMGFIDQAWQERYRDEVLPA